MKVKLTEQQFKNIIKRELDEMSCMLGEGITSKDIEYQKDQVMNKMMQVYQNNKPILGGEDTFANRMNQIGNHIGTYYDGSVAQQTAQDKQGMYDSMINNNNAEGAIREVITILVGAAYIMRQNKMVTDKGRIVFPVYNAYSTNGIKKNDETYEYNGIKYDASMLMKCKDALDLLSLNWFYMPTNTWQDNANKTTSQLAKSLKNVLDKNGDLADKLFRYFKNATGSYIEGTRVPTYKKMYPQYCYYKKMSPKEVEKKGDGDWAVTMEEIPPQITSESPDFICVNGEYYKLMLDKKALLAIKNKKTGERGEEGKQVEAQYFTHLVNKMLTQVYGMQLTMPEDIFSLGNNKLSKDTLIINFTSAHRCPAWNECLLKNSCYAKATEHGYTDAFGKNKKMTMMWEASQYDQEIMDSLKTLIRLYIVNLSQLRSYVNQNNTEATYGEVAEGIENKQEEDYCFTLVRNGFDKMPENIVNIIKNIEGVKRANYVRLNEAGDFIGQWLVDAMDIFAGELKIIGVSTTAYTCRSLNYDGIKNIIINASRAQIKGNVARRFIAIPEEMYNSLRETYTTSEENVVYNENGMPNEKNITSPVIVEDKIVPYPQPMYDESGGRMEGYYYKCPCGRGKKSDKEQTKTEKIFNNVLNPDSKTIKSGVGCYQCRMCYEPKSSLSDKPIVVYVQVHSTEKDQFNYVQQQGAGFSSDYAKNLDDLRNGLNENAGQYNDENEMIAIQQITNNAIQSVNEHLTGLAQQKLEEERIKKDFFDTLRKLM